MRIKLLCMLPVALCAAILALTAHSAHSQSADAKQSAGPAGDPAKARVDEFVEAKRSIVGPAGEPECVWLGKRVVGLIYRDDPDNAQRMLDVYDRFRCPGFHVQEAFRCVVRQGNPDPKASPEAANIKTNDRIHACWLNPAMPSTQPATAATPGTTPTGSASTTR